MRKKKSDHLKAKPVGITLPAEFVEYLQLTDTSPSKILALRMAEDILGISFVEFEEAYTRLKDSYTSILHAPKCLDESARVRFLRTARWMVRGKIHGVYVQKYGWACEPEYLLHVEWLATGKKAWHTVEAGIYNHGEFLPGYQVPPLECLYTTTLPGLPFMPDKDVQDSFDDHYEFVIENGDKFSPDFIFQKPLQFKDSDEYYYPNILSKKGVLAHLADEGDMSIVLSACRRVADGDRQENELVTRLMSRWVQLSAQLHGSIEDC